MALFPASERFWSAQAAWTSATVKAQGGASTGLVRKEARWRLSAERYLRTLPSLATRAWIDPGPDSARIAAQLIEGISEEVIKVMDPILARAITEAWKDWPVASGLSKSLLILIWTADGDTLIGTLRNGAPYATLIRSAKVGSSRLPTPIAPQILLVRAQKQASEEAITALAKIDMRGQVTP